MDLRSLNWSDVSKYRFKFIQTVDSDFKDITFIYPSKQPVVNELYKRFRDNRFVDTMYIFGSVTDIRCNVSSDIDVAVRLYPDYNTKEVRNRVSELIQCICEWNADVIWINDLKYDERLYHEIMGGVRIV